MSLHFKPLLLFIFIVLPTLACKAQNDSLQHVDIKREASVVAWKSNDMLKHSEAGHTQWKLDNLQQLPQILGNADPLRYTQSLPSVQTSNEFDAGLHVQGCATGQNAVLLGENVIYNPSHLMGIFSAFNANHFSQLDFSTLSTPDKPNRIGGFLSMQLQEIAYKQTAKKTKTELSVGPLSSQGTFNVYFSPSVQLILSARQAYMNLLYKKWISFDGNETRYSFCDYNATLIYAPNTKNSVTFNGYWGQDKANYYQGTHLMQTKLKWSNYAAECTWLHTQENGGKIKQSIFSSGYANRLSMKSNNFELQLPSFIRTYGYHLDFNTLHLRLGTEYLLHKVKPQSPTFKNDYYTPNSPTFETTNHELSVYAQYFTPFAHDALNLSVGTRFTYFRSDDNQGYFCSSPQARLTWKINSEHSLAAHTSISHQFLHQTGFTSLGLPTEFWFASNREQKPQRSENVSLLYDFKPHRGKYSLTIEAYFKRLHNQKEYNDNVLSLMQQNYDLQTALLSGSGLNYGIGAQLTKHTGRLTGWVSYAYGRSLRKFGSISSHKMFPSNYERCHEVNAVANIRILPHFTLSIVGIASSGTPLTAAESFYYINGYIVPQYGEHNAYNLPWYKRIDVSADIQLKSHTGLHHGLNLSLLNVFGFNNKLFYRLGTKENEYKYQPIGFLNFPLPSISYYLKI